MITSKQAAKLKGVTPCRIRQLCKQGRIKPTPELIGRDWVLADDFEVIEAPRKRPGKIKMVGK